MTNSSRLDSSSHRTSTKGDLPSVLKKDLSKEKVRTYVDANGFNVIEYQTPTTHLILRYNDADMVFIHNSQIRYSGPIKHDIIDNELAKLDTTLGRGFDDDFFDFEQRIKEFDRDVDKWNQNFDKLINEFPTFSSTPRLENSSHKNPNQYQWSYSYSKSTSNTSPYHGSVHNNRDNEKSGCLGCFLWAILSFVIFCLILYGMGALGGAIWDFFSELFNSIFH